MVAQRVLVLLVCWAALLATCLPQGVFLGHLTSKGKVIGDVYAVNRTTLRIENLNLSGTDGDIVFTFASKKAAARNITLDKTTAVPSTSSLSQDRVVRALQKEVPGLIQLSLTRTLRQSIDNLVKGMDNNEQPTDSTVKSGDRCEPGIDTLPRENENGPTDLKVLVSASSTMKDMATCLYLPLLPKATSLLPPGTTSAGITSLSPTATSTVDATLLSPTAISTTDATSLSPTATTSVGTASPSPTTTTSVGATSLSSTTTSTAGGTSLSPTTATTTSPSPTVTAHTVLNCASLTSGYGVCWERKRRSGKFILCAKGIGPGQYMAFGWSRNVKKTTMDKSDAVVCNHHINGTWDVEDYYLESRKPCGTNQEGQTVGVCPDTAFGEASNIVITSGLYENSIGYCTFKRRLYSARRHDMKVTVKKKQAIVWAIGPIGPDGQIQKHSKRADETQFFQFVDGGQPCKLGNPTLCCNNIIQQ